MLDFADRGAADNTSLYQTACRTHAAAARYCESAAAGRIMAPGVSEAQNRRTYEDSATMKPSASKPATESAPRFSAALSRAADASEAVGEVCDRILSSHAAAERTGSSGKSAAPPALVLVFLSHHHRAKAAAVAGGICDRLHTAALIGCTGESIAGGGEEIEDGPALAVWAADFPEGSVDLMHLDYARTPDGDSFVGWPDSLVEAWPEQATLLLLAEPFSFPADVLLESLSEEHPGVIVIGGMASGGHSPGENRLLFGRDEVRQGAVAVMLSDTVRVRPVVSQGCRPIGKPLVITKAERNIVYELGGRPPLALLKELFATLGPEDQRMMQSGLHLGRVTNEYQDQFGRGDFLVRNVIGVDGENGAIAVGDYVRTGQTVQFHLRDAASADEDLRELLKRVNDEGRPAAALLFTCNGRGTRLFDAPHHDAGAVRDVLGDIPLAGFFAQGEIGPIGARSYVHGFTASLAVFETGE
jgi:small ligand-binding sensory domain FIST